MITELIAAAPPVVHATGINWASVGTIAGSVFGSVFAAARYVVSRVEGSRARAQSHNEKFVTEQVGQVARILDLKLEKVNEHLGAQDLAQTTMVLQIADVRDRTARIEGQLSRPMP